MQSSSALITGRPVDAVLRISHPGNGQLRVRKVVSRSKTRGTGKYPSWKMQRMLQWESPHELNAMRLLDADPGVDRFREQPLTITYMVDEIEHRHVPDLEVVRSGQSEIWEVKMREEACLPEVVRRTQLLAAALPPLGYSYRLIIAESLGAEPRLANTVMVLRYGRNDIPLLERERLRRLLVTKPELTWGVILAGALGPRSRDNACRLVLEGVLRIDLNAPIHAQSRIAVVGSVTRARMGDL